MFFQKDLETMPRKELEALQLERLKWVVDYCYRNVPFYQKRLDQCGVTADKIKQLSDGWTVKTKDGGLAAHFEHSNAILKDRTEIMTRFWDDPDFDPETFSLK